MYVRAVEFKPGDRKVVHHAIFYLDKTGTARDLDAKDTAEGYACFGGPGFIPTGNLGGWVPGATPRVLPDGLAYRLRKGSDIVIQVHFHPTGKLETEQSTIALYFAKKPPEKRLMTLIMNSRKIDIPAGDSDYLLRDFFELPADIRALSIQPHAHFLGHRMHIWADLPDHTVRELLTVSDWDFNWQDKYDYSAPVSLPKGTTLRMEYHYDNSVRNIQNPSYPPREVKFGQQSTDEMGITFINFTPASSSDIPVLQNAITKKWITSRSNSPILAAAGSLAVDAWMNKLIQYFDAEHKGYLDEDEWEQAIAYLKWKKSKQSED